ncbi:MAG: DUF973 family protein [Desulfurococcales archaeon]|nr:DUF973 family protein [Desulfurococcales archaeon]
MQNADRRMLAEGLSVVRDGIKLYLIAIIVVVVGVVAAIIAVIGAVGFASILEDPTSSGEYIVEYAGYTLITFLILIIVVMVVLGFMAISRVKRGMEVLASVYRDVEVGLLGAKMIYYGIILTLVGAVLVIVLVGIVVMVVGLLLLILGRLLWGLGMLNLDKALTTDLKTPALLYIAAVVLSLVPYLSIIGAVLELAALYMMYTNLGTELDNMRIGGHLPPGTWSRHHP